MGFDFWQEKPGPHSVWDAFMSITRQFQHARTLYFGSSVTDFIGFPTSFIRFLSSYEAVIVPWLRFDGRDFHMPPEFHLSCLTSK